MVFQLPDDRYTTPKTVLDVVDSQDQQSQDQPSVLDQHFNKFDFPLSPFQKFAIEAIVTGNHSLSCVPTGSGKTLPALFAIEFFTAMKKKVIYTSPIKALSNQKYYEFKQKFPHLSIGLLTGDIKINPEADVLIMTAEILQNTLHLRRDKQLSSVDILTVNEVPAKAVPALFEIDFDTELGCVIQDEVHMINDVDRGHVWENIIMLLPSNIQMIMLSATLDNPIKFAQWIESCHHDNTDIDCISSTSSTSSTSSRKPQVYLATSTHRPVPLTHYSFIATTNALYKTIKDKDEQARLRRQMNTLHVIQTAKGTFNDSKYHEIKKTTDLLSEKKVFIKRSFVLNEVCKHMVEKNMLPAVCFILSKKQIQSASKEISVPLLGQPGQLGQNEDSKDNEDTTSAYTVKRECEQLLRSKLPNYQEYLSLPEYTEMVTLLQKGIAIHHSGVLPILREIVELMFEKGHVKLLFATETFSVGLNMPIKTVLFTDVKKFDGTGMRMLLPHEFVQASGRAGRRGIDTVGNVIHLTNLFRDVQLIDYRTMMQGKPQTLVSKFKLSYDTLFAGRPRTPPALHSGEADDFPHVSDIRTPHDPDSSSPHVSDTHTPCAKQGVCEVSPQKGACGVSPQSMLQHEISAQLEVVREQLADARVLVGQTAECVRVMRTPSEQVYRYTELLASVRLSKNKARKQMEREISELHETYPDMASDVKVCASMRAKAARVDALETECGGMEGYIENRTNILVQRLVEDGYLTEDTCQPTVKSLFASNIRETPCMVFGELIPSDEFRALDAIGLVVLFSCFTGISSKGQQGHSDEYDDDRDRGDNTSTMNTIRQVRRAYDVACRVAHDYEDFEATNHVDTGTDYSLSGDLIPYVHAWCIAENAEECKLVLQDMSNHVGVLAGEFVKAILKINNIATEVERVGESVGDMQLVGFMKEVPALTLKFIATNQSMYV